MIAAKVGINQIARAILQPPSHSDVGTAIVADKLAEIASNVTYTPVINSRFLGNCSRTIVGINTLPTAIAKPIINVKVISGIYPPKSLKIMARNNAIKTHIIARFSVRRLTKAGLANAPIPKQTTGSEVSKPTWKPVSPSTFCNSSTSGPIEPTGGRSTSEIKIRARIANNERLTTLVNVFPCSLPMSQVFQEHTSNPVRHL